MAMRLAVVSALLIFAVCLVVGSLQADNTFPTVVGRALEAMAATLVIGLVLGSMGHKMIEENLKSEEEKFKNSSASSPPGDR